MHTKSNQLEPYLSVLSSFDNKKPLRNAHRTGREDARVPDQQGEYLLVQDFALCLTESGLQSVCILTFVRQGVARFSCCPRGICGFNIDAKYCLLSSRKYDWLLRTVFRELPSRSLTKERRRLDSLHQHFVYRFCGNDIHSDKPNDIKKSFVVLSAPRPVGIPKGRGA